MFSQLCKNQMYFDGVSVDIHALYKLVKIITLELTLLCFDLTITEEWSLPGCLLAGCVRLLNAHWSMQK